MQRPQKTSSDGWRPRDRFKTEEYAGACSPVFTEMERQDGIDLIDKVVDINNLFNACKKVKANKGVPGVDEMTVDELFGHVAKYRTQLIRKLKDGSYEPLPVKRVEIPKLDGSKRKLGILCVRDRMVQQAIYQVIGKIIAPHFSEGSYGFRPRRNQH
ncbi:hypothetical protein [Sporosarcina sp. OR05]|uniref:hypothetical protein n=1 Tax=Sporosarcina sp. OR05 TaxID=2969819 RepID=UPI003529F5C3